MLGSEMYKFYMGWNWYIVVFYVPMLVVSQVLILQQLLRKSMRPSGGTEDPA